MPDRRSQRGGQSRHRSRRRQHHQPHSIHPRLDRVLVVYAYGLLAVTCVGQILHEYAHKRACDNLGIPVEKVCYFQFDAPPGYVVYQLPRYYGHAIGIALAPLFSNTLLACVLLVGVIGGLDVWGLPPISSEYLWTWVGFVGASWIGLSCAMHAVPSRPDADLAWTATVERFPAIGPLCAGPLVLVAYVLSRLDRVGIDYIYTGALVSGVVTGYHSCPLLRTTVRVGLGLLHGV